MTTLFAWKWASWSTPAADSYVLYLFWTPKLNCNFYYLNTFHISWNVWWTVEINVHCCGKWFPSAVCHLNTFQWCFTLPIQVSHYFNLEMSSLFSVYLTIHSLLKGYISITICWDNEIRVENKITFVGVEWISSRVSRVVASFKWGARVQCILDGRSNPMGLSHF